MLTIRFKNNTVTITQGGEPKVLSNSAKEDTEEKSESAVVSSAAAGRDAKDAPKKGGGGEGDVSPGGGGEGDVGPGGGGEGDVGPSGGGPGSVVVVGPVIMTAFRSAQRRPVLSEPIVKHVGLGVSHEATKVPGTNQPSTSKNAESNQKGSGGEGDVGPGGGGPGSVIVIGPVVIQNSLDGGSPVQADKAQQAGAGAATRTRDRS